MLTTVLLLGLQGPTTTVIDNGGGRPSILPRPGENESPTNAIGFIVIVVAVLLWVAGMAIMLRRAAKRRRPVRA